VPRICRIGLNFGAKSTDVNVDKPAISEIVIAPHFVEERFTAEHLARVVCKFAEQSEFSLGEMNLFTAA
tara:strand:+ start:286 stop:492 length:207 start_codon:yes stop_codon:yes gene_type:complete